MTDDGKASLEKYVARIERSIEKYKQSNDEKEDIFLCIREKLDSASQEQEVISVGTIVRIMNEIGEWEDIFRDASKNMNSEKNSWITGIDVKDFFKREFHRNQKTGIILGICSGISETFEINPLWIRLLFIVLTLAYGSGIIIYIFLGILMPDVSRNRKSEVIPKKQKIEEQAEELAEDIKSRVEEYSKGKPWIISGFIGTIIRTFLGLGKFIAIILRFGFFGGISVALLLGALALIAGAACISSQPILDMQSIFFYVPPYTGWAMIPGALAAIILTVMAMAKAIWREVGNFTILVMSFILGGVTLFFWVEAFMKVAPHYTNEYSKIVKTDFTADSGSTITIDTQGVMENMFGASTRISLKKSLDTKIHIIYESQIRAGSKEEWEKILSKITGITSSFTWGILTIKLEGENSFSQIVPLSFPERTLQILIPENIAISVPENNPSSLYYEVATDMQAMGVWSCDGLKALYVAKRNAFICRDDSLSLKEKIIGSWVKNTYEEWEKRGIILNRDNSVASINTKISPYLRWEVKEDSLILYGANKEKELSSYTEDVFRIVSLQDRQLELEQDGVYIQYTRK